jgi:ketopantoate reductase
MRILVYGSGPAAVLSGYVLGRAGHQVRHAAAAGQGGPAAGPVRLRLMDASAPARTPTSTSYDITLADPGDAEPELVLVTVPHAELPAALPAVAKRRGHGRVVLFSELWDEPHVADEDLPRREYLWAYPAVAGAWRDDGWLEGVVLRWVGLNSADGLPTPLLAETMGLFATAGLKPYAQHDVVPWLRTRFAIEAAVAGAACVAGGPEPLLASVKHLQTAVMGARDALRVAERTGVDVTAFADARSLYYPAPAAVRILRSALKRDHLTRRFIELRVGGAQMPDMLADVMATADRLGMGVPDLQALAACLLPAAKPV